MSDTADHDDGDIDTAEFERMFAAEFEQLAREIIAPLLPDQSNPRDATRG